MTNSKGGVKKKCPKCGSMETRKFGIYVSVKGKRQKHHCRKCGTVWSGGFIDEPVSIP